MASRSPKPRSLFFNNAGSVGPLGYVAEDLGSGAGGAGGASGGLSSLLAMQASINLNVTSALWLSSQFTHIFGAPRTDTGGAAAGDDGNGGGGTAEVVDAAAGAGEAEEGEQAMADCIVNVSSLAAVQAFPSWGVYCRFVAARASRHHSSHDHTTTVPPPPPTTPPPRYLTTPAAKLLAICSTRPFIKSRSTQNGSPPSIMVSQG